MMMISSPKLLKGRMKRVIEGENEESEDDQDDEESTPPTRPSTNKVEDLLKTLQDLSKFSTRGDEIRFLVLSMESLLVRERIDNLKQCFNWLFQKKTKEEKSFSKPPVSIFSVFIKLFKNWNYR